MEPLYAVARITKANFPEDKQLNLKPPVVLTYSRLTGWLDRIVAKTSERLKLDISLSDMAE